MTPSTLDPGITPAGGGTEWRILGHTYWMKASSDGSFAFETLDPPGTFVPVHTHPTQDEFIYVLENGLHLYLDGRPHEARAGDLVRMPAGIPHGYYNLSDRPTRALFWVSPARQLRALFEVLHDMTDLDAVVRESAAREVLFAPPEAYAYDPLATRAGA